MQTPNQQHLEALTAYHKFGMNQPSCAVWMEDANKLDRQVQVLFDGFRSKQNKNPTSRKLQRVEDVLEGLTVVSSSRFAFVKKYFWIAQDPLYTAEAVEAMSSTVEKMSRAVMEMEDILGELE